MAGGFTTGRIRRRSPSCARKAQGQPDRGDYKKIVEGDEGAKDVMLKSGDIIIIRTDERKLTS